jgi:hypothetical protein
LILFDIAESESNAVYQSMAISNGDRQFSFLKSIVGAALESGKPYLSQNVIKALNFHAIACLHVNAGEYRPCEVVVGKHQPPQMFRVNALMDDFVNDVNRNWADVDAVALASFVLWRLNYIHPFINGNGRTARAACYFVLCVKLGGWLPGTPILPARLTAIRGDYVDALMKVDESMHGGKLDLTPLSKMIGELTQEQVESADGKAQS